MSDSEQPKPRPGNIFERFSALRSQTKLLIATAAFLLMVAVVFRGCSGVDVSSAEAIQTARSRIDFSGLEPIQANRGRTEARILRQGIPTTAQWAVVFLINDPDGSAEDFLCHARVYINAGDGNLERDADLGESAEACPWRRVADA